MADTVISGTSGNDTTKVLAGTSGTSGSLVLTLAGTFAEGAWPLINVLVNGEIALANVSVTANHDAGATQQVSLALPAGTSVTSVGIQYLNDDQMAYVEDRNLFVSSVTLDGTALAVGSATYTRDGLATIAGQQDMKWGGTLQFSGLSEVTPAAGTVFVDGLAGLDTAVFSGPRSQFTISHPSSSYTVASNVSSDTVSLSNVERFEFSDYHLAVDMSGNAGTTAQLIGAIFGTSYLAVREYVGLGLDLLDQGMSATDLATLAVGTPLFTQLAGSTSNAAFVETVAENIGYTGDVSIYVQQLDSGATTKGALAVMAAGTEFNAAHLVGVMQNGIEYV